MRKFLAVVKHEYKKVVLKWSFLIGTLLLPFLAACFAVVPAVIFSLKGDATRIAVIDLSGKIEPRLKANLSAEKIMEKGKKAAKDSMTDLNPSQEEQMKRGSQQFAEGFVFVGHDAQNKSPEDIRSELTERVKLGEIDAYLIVPSNIDSADARFEFRSRKGSDFVTTDTFRDALNEAVRSQRLTDANISEERLAELSSNVDFDAKGIDEKGEEKIVPARLSPPLLLD